MDHEPGADTPGQDPESSESPEAPPRVPPYIAPPAAWGEPTPTPEPAPFADTPIPASELRDPAPTEATYVTDAADATDSLPPVEPVMPAPAGNEPPPPSWAWSTEARQPAAAGVAAASGAAATGGASAPKRNGGMRSALVGGIAGAIDRRARRRWTPRRLR